MIFPKLILLLTLSVVHVALGIQVERSSNVVRRANDENEAVNKLIEALDSSLAECGLDLASMRNPDMPTNPVALLQMVKLSRPCDAQEEAKMMEAFLNFEKCSGYEELELVEDLYVSLVGAMIKCVNSMRALDMATMNIPEDCAVAILGNHPLGQMVRDEILRPESTEKCFDNLGNEVPICTVDLFPYPVDGKTVKMNACVGSKIEEIFLEQCVEGLETLMDCLPEASQITFFSDCQKYIKQCTDGAGDSLFAMVLMAMPRTLRGIPLPESCRDDANAKGLTEQVNRYEAFRDVCAAEGKALWERLDSSVDDPGNPKLKSIKEFIRPTEGTYSMKQSAVSATSSDGKGGGSFGFGMLAGIVLALVGYGILLIVKKHRGASEKIEWPGYVELASFVR